MLHKSEESLTFTCKRDTNRDIKLHQLRDLEKARLVVAEDSIGDHKREATHDIVPRSLASATIFAIARRIFRFLSGRRCKSHVPGSHFSSSNSRNQILVNKRRN